MKRFIALTILVVMMAIPGWVTSRRDTSSVKHITEITRDVSPTWQTDTSVAASIAKADAIRETIYIMEAPNVENYGKYFSNILSDPQNAIWPVGGKSCLTSATAMYTEMMANTTITDGYDIAITKTGGHANAVGFPHFMIEMIPNDNVGPAYLVDRYLDNGTFLTIERKYLDKKAKKDADAAIHITTLVADPWEMLDAWYETVSPQPDPVYCSWNFDHIVLGGIVPDIDSAKAALNSAVNSVPEGLPCGNSISKMYGNRSCPAGIDNGVRYLSRCVWSDLVYPIGYTTFTTFIIGYESTD